jgi:hypothetical protein
MRKLTIIAFTALVILSLYHCNLTSREENLPPVLNSISPNSKVSHLPGFTLTASGSNFNHGSIIVFNGREKQTIYVSSTELTCQVEPDDITLSSLTVYPGDNVSRTWSEEVTVLVRNPSPAGDSNSLNFTIKSNHTFTDPVNITNQGQVRIDDFDLAADGTGNIYVSYWSLRSNPLLNGIYLIRSADYGTNWNQENKVTGGSNNYLFHKMDLDSAGNIYMIWTSFGFEKGIYFSRSNNNGTTWRNAVQVYDIQHFPIGNSCITVGHTGNLYIIYQKYSGNVESVSLKSIRSTDNGFSWSYPVEIYNKYLIKNSNNYCLNPSITADNDGNIYAFWTTVNFSTWEYSVYFSRLDNTGVTWSQPEIINSSEFLQVHHIAVDYNGNINMLWYVGLDKQMYFRRFTDKGSTGGEIITLFTGLKMKHPLAMAVDNAGNINILFNANIQEDVSGLLFSRSTDNGQTWSQPLEIPYICNISTTKMTVDYAGNLYIAFLYYGQFAIDLYFSRSN